MGPATGCSLQGQPALCSISSEEMDRWKSGRSSDGVVPETRNFVGSI